MTHLTVPVGDRDHSQGPSGAAITLVEYGDYECPHCAQALAVVQQLQKAHGERLRFVYRSFARVSAHSQGGRAAEAAAAAGSQGKFWEMHGLLLTHQQELDEAHLMIFPVLHADVLGMDVDRFQQEMAGHAHAERVREDLASGVASGVKSTPTFFINGVRHDDYWDVETLSAALEAATK